MKKRGLKLTVLLVLGAFVFLWLIKAPLMASYLTKKLGVPVSVGAIAMRPDHTLIRNFKIKNPRGFKTADAFKAKKTLLNYTLQDLRKDPCEIDEIQIEQIFLSVDFSDRAGKSNNWTAIASRLPNKEDSREVKIHKLILSDIDVEIKGLELSGLPQKQHIDRIELNEIDSEEGFPTRELISQFFNHAGLGQYLQNAFNPEKVIEEVLSPFSGFGE